jgi:hypothetical protein
MYYLVHVILEIYLLIPKFNFFFMFRFLKVRRKERKLLKNIKKKKDIWITTS